MTQYSYVKCPCCGQTITVSYNDLYGFSIEYPFSNIYDWKNALLSQQKCSLYDQWVESNNTQLLKEMINSK